MQLFTALIGTCLIWAAVGDDYCTPHKGATFKAGAYQDIRVLIDSTEKQDFTLIQKIKDLFSNTSSALHTALNQKGYFGSVRIILPSTWNPPANTTFESATVDDLTEQVPEFKIAPQNPARGTPPYCARKDNECGKEGDYVHLTSLFVNTYSKLGNMQQAGKQVVQAFAQQRFGVFPEYYDAGQLPDLTQNYPFDTAVCLSYHDPLPTSCPKFESPKSGKFVSASAGNEKRCHPCADGTSFKDVTSQHVPPPDCHDFKPEFQDNQDYSLMYTADQAQVVHFCDSSNHNSEAHNLQNANCQRQSVWSIINKNVDFNSNCPHHSSTGVLAKTTNTEPKFTIVRNNDPRSVAFVLDTSGSMSSNNPQRIKVLNLAATGAIECIPEGEKIAVTRFSTSASTLHPLTSIVGESSRIALENSIPKRAVGSTALGQGIEQGISALNAGLDVGETKNARLVIISDGAENVAPLAYSKVVQKKIQNAGVAIDTIGISSAASIVLVELANEYGGNFFFLNTGGTAWRSSLQNAVSTLCRICRAVDQRNNVAQLYSATTDVPSGSFYVDKFSSGPSTMLFLNPTGKVSVQLTDPDGDVLNSTSPAYHVRSNGQTVSIRLNTTKVGKWKFDFTTTSEVEEEMSDAEKEAAIAEDDAGRSPDQNRTPKNKASAVAQVNQEAAVQATKDVSILVNAESSDPTLTLHISTSYNRQNITDIATEPVIVYTSVMAGPSAVLNAEVNVTINPPSSCGVTKPADVYLQPKDDGIGADAFANDGIYSAYFMDFTSIKAAKKDCRFAGSASATGGSETTFNNAGKSEPTGQFDRFSSIPYFTINLKKVPKGDVIPPGRINDFSLNRTSYTNDQVAFQWTAPGDDYYVGTASEYEIWYAEDVGALVELNATQMTQVNSSQVVSGSVNASFAPHQAGTMETITLTDFPNRTNLYFGIRAVDSAGNVAQLSNLLQVDIQPPPSSSPSACRLSVLLVACCLLASKCWELIG